MSNTKQRGHYIQLWVNGKAIALATNHSLSVTSNTDNTSTKDDSIAQTVTVIGTSWTMSCDAVLTGSADSVSQTFDSLFTMQKAGDSIPVKWAKHALDTPMPTGGWEVPTKDYYEGNAVITQLDQQAPNEGNATISVQFTGDGDLNYHA